MGDADVVQHDIEAFISSDEVSSDEVKAHKADALKIIIEREVLLKALAHVQNVVEKRNTIPILANVKLEADDEGLKLTATDMEMSVTETVQATIETAGSLTVPAHTLYDIVRKLPEGAQIELDSTEGKGGTLVMRAGSCKFSLACLPAKEFPVMDDSGLTHHFSLPVTECVALIDKTKFAVSTEETRYYLNGIYLHTAKNDNETVLRSVATDGHRLARMEVELPDGADGMPGVIFPRKAVLELRKIVEEGDELIQISLSATKIRFVCGNVVLLSKLIDGTFPDYEKVIPAANDKIMEVEKSVLIKSVDRVATIASDKSRAIKCKLTSGSLVLSANDDGNGTAREELEVQYGADTIEIGFNSRYLLEMMGGIEGDVAQFVFADGSAPALVRDASDMRALYVIMPMRV